MAMFKSGDSFIHIELSASEFAETYEKDRKIIQNFKIGDPMPELGLFILHPKDQHNFDFRKVNGGLFFTFTVSYVTPLIKSVLFGERIFSVLSRCDKIEEFIEFKKKQEKHDLTPNKKIAMATLQIVFCRFLEKELITDDHKKIMNNTAAFFPELPLEIIKVAKYIYHLSDLYPGSVDHMLRYIQEKKENQNKND